MAAIATSSASSDNYAQREGAHVFYNSWGWGANNEVAIVFGADAVEVVNSVGQFGSIGSHNQGKFRIQTFAKILLYVVCVKEFLKILPFFHIYVSSHFHSPANFQSLHNSPITWIVLFFSKRWRSIADESVDFEKKSPNIIHIMADVILEDLPQLIFTFYLIAIGRKIPCFAASSMDTSTRVAVIRALLEKQGGLSFYCSDPYDGELMHDSEVYASELQIPSSLVLKLDSHGTYLFESGQVYCLYSGESFLPPLDFLTPVISSPKVEVEFDNSCNTIFAANPLIPFCSCSGFGGGFDAVMVFSLAMTVFSTLHKAGKLVSNIRKRHALVEKHYRDKDTTVGHLPVVPATVGDVEMTYVSGLQYGQRSQENEIHVPPGEEENTTRQTYAESARRFQALEERVGLLDSYAKILEGKLQSHTKDVEWRLQRLEGGGEGGVVRAVDRSAKV